MALPATSAPRTPIEPPMEETAAQEAARAIWAANRPPGTLPAEPGKPFGIPFEDAPTLKGGVLMSDLVIQDRR